MKSITFFVMFVTHHFVVQAPYMQKVVIHEFNVTSFCIKLLLVLPVKFPA